MKAPEKISEADFVELETLVKANPFFQNGHSIVARASRRLKKPNAAKKMNTAAMYATNRNIFKQYILGQIKFDQPKVAASGTPQPTPTKTGATAKTVSAPRKAPKHNTEEEQSALVKEIYENLEKWKASREHYLDYDKKHPEEIVIEDPNSSTPATPQVEEQKEAAPIPAEIPKVQETSDQTSTDEPKDSVAEKNVDEVEKIKNQVVEEIEAEEESISKALSDIAEKNKKQEDSPQEAGEPKAKESPKASIPTISSDELTAIVDAESSEDESNPTQEAKDTVEEIEQSIAPEPQVSEPEASETINETIDSTSTAEVEEIAQEPEVIEEVESIKEDIEETKIEEVENESEDTLQDEPEDEIELAISIDTSSDKSTEETEEVLDQLDKEIQELKLTPGSSKTGKKFRLGVLKRGTKFTKERVKKTGIKATSKKAATPPKKTTSDKQETTVTAKKTAVKKQASTKTEKKATTKSSSPKNTKKAIPAKTVTKKAKEEKPTSKKVSPTTKTTTTAKKKATTKKQVEEKKTVAKKTTPKVATKKTSSAKSEPKAKTDTAKKSATKKAAPKFRMSATLGAKNKKKSTPKKSTKKDDDSSSEKKKPKEVGATAKKGAVDQSNIIDSFIELNPTIQVSKEKLQEDSPVEDLAARYDAFPDHLVTENLATILVSQGKVEKAIDIYQKLILKNPQKKAYFASQIEKLNKK